MGRLPGAQRLWLLACLAGVPLSAIAPHTWLQVGPVVIGVAAAWWRCGAGRWSGV